MLKVRPVLRFETATRAPWGSARPELLSEPWRRWSNGQGREDRSEQDWHAPMNAWEDDQQFHLELELPGVSRDDLSLTVQEGVLLISAERHPSGQGRAFCCRERRYGRTERTFPLPDFADLESIEAELRDGILRVSIGKKPEVLPKRIKIKTN